MQMLWAFLQRRSYFLTIKGVIVPTAIKILVPSTKRSMANDTVCFLPAHIGSKNFTTMNEFSQCTRVFTNQILSKATRKHRLKACSITTVKSPFSTNKRHLHEIPQSLPGSFVQTNQTNQVSLQPDAVMLTESSRLTSFSRPHTN